MQDQQPTPNALPAVISRKLREFERARNRVLGGQAVAEAFLALGLAILLISVIEGFARSSLSWRLLMTVGVTTIVCLWLLVRLARVFFRRSELRTVARDFENAAGFEAKERIWSAVELAGATGRQTGLSQWMVEQTIAAAATQIEEVAPGKLIDRKALSRAWKRVGGLAAVLLLGALFGGGGRLWLALNPYASTVAFSRVRFVVNPGNCSVPEGTNLVIKISTSQLPEAGKLLVTWADGGHESIPLTQIGTNAFQSEISGVAQSFHYQVVAEEAESPVFEAKVVFAPKLASLRVSIEPPAYTGWTNQSIEGGSAEFIEGSRITVEATTTKEKIQNAEFVMDEGGTRKFALSNALLRLELTPTNPVNYGIRLLGENGLVMESARENSLTPRPDLPPTAVLTAEGLGYGLVQQDEIIPLSIQATDDVGLGRVDLILVGADLKRELRNLFEIKTNTPFGSGSSTRDFSISPKLSLQEIKPHPGDELQLLVQVTDVKGQSNESNPVSLTIGAVEKTLEARLAERLKVLLAQLQTGSEDLKAARTSWLAEERNYREQDRLATVEHVSLTKSRITNLEHEIERVGKTLVDESRTNAVHDARFIYRLGTSLTSWGREQGIVLRREMDRVSTSAPAELPAVFGRGSDLLNLATADLKKMTRVVALLQGALETDVLATRCEMAQGQYKRAFPVVRGETESLTDAYTNRTGLNATFFEGIELKGRVLEQKVALPRFENYAPGKRSEDWSCRYEGEVRILEAGEWNFACIADDGVRLWLDGRSILPDTSWSAHAATEFGSSQILNAGWHRVMIEFFQGSSLSKLQFLMARNTERLREVPAYLLRPQPLPDSPPTPVSAKPLAPEILNLVRARLTSSLGTMVTVTPTLTELTNGMALARLNSLIDDGAPTSLDLSNQLSTVTNWLTVTNSAAEGDADLLTALSLEARRMVREELDQQRWHFEGTEAMEDVHTSIEELRTINEQLRHLPWNDHKTLDEKEQAQVNLAKAWEQELERTTREAAHHLFEEARRPDATLAERMLALNATAKIERELAPAVAKLAPKLEQDTNKVAMGDEIDRRLNEISDRYRELNDLQEHINREHVAGVARAALPTVRAFARAQQQGKDQTTNEKFEDARREAGKIVEAERVVGDYQAATQLETLAGDSPGKADGPALAKRVRDIASQTDRNPPSLAESIPPPMQKETSALAAGQESGTTAANRLAVPRLAMSLEAARLSRNGDKKLANAYELLGQDLGQAINTPEQLTDTKLQPLTDRALALAGRKGDEARQAEIKAAAARLAQMKDRQSPANLAMELEELSTLATDAGRDKKFDEPLNSRLATLEKVATPVQDWSESTDAAEVAASAAQEAEQGLEANPKNREAHAQAAEILGDAARQIRMEEAIQDLAHHDPFPGQPDGKPDGPPTPGEPGNKPDRQVKLDGPTGKALTQAAPKGIDQAEWARLNELLRKNIRNAGADNFTPEQRAAIQAYFEKLGSVK